MDIKEFLLSLVEYLGAMAEKHPDAEQWVVETHNKLLHEAQDRLVEMAKNEDEVNVKKIVLGYEVVPGPDGTRRKQKAIFFIGENEKKYQLSWFQPVEPWSEIS